ncbi:exo-beta-N-acetylmuramidase NamZ domain-containing protein [Brevibacillus sp. GCM10020057]|uniref:exo-beta-N-acetylmuramidase NamZ family protein n=1 Tax=Brevibacillus sp. GCM10020057 TaxID=3317327 RepID=UPI0036348E41
MKKATAWQCSLCILLLFSFLAAGAVAREEQPPAQVKIQTTAPAVRTGIERLLEQPAQLLGKRVGLITNQTGVTSGLVHDVDALLEKKIQLVAVYGPEHGIRGAEQAGSAPESFQDAKTGLPFYNLYGKEPQEIARLFRDVDVVLYDIQDVGARFYTYISTMAYAMKAAAMEGKPFIVLDRPNPLGGEKVEGPILDLHFQSFVGLYPIPLRHGMTVGELAGWIRKQDLEKEYGAKADLTVIRMEGWKRGMQYEDTGLPWVPPSPNMPTVGTAAVYPGNGLFEGTNLSEGRGTTLPFEWVGAPYINGWELAHRLNRLKLPGVAFREAYFQPAFSKHAGKTIGGVQFYVTDRQAYEPVRTALTVMAEVKKQYPRQFDWRGDHWIDKLLGTDAVRKALDQGTPVNEIVAKWQEELRAFEMQRKPFLLYGTE